MMAEFDTDVFDDVEEETKEEVKEAKAEETDTKEETDAEKGATEDKSETEDGEEKSEEEESPSSKDTSDEEAGRLATTIAERKRRQEAVAENKELKKQLQRIQESQQEVPDAATDPDGYALYHDNKTFARILENAEEIFEETQEGYPEAKAVFTNLVSEVVDGKTIQKDETLYRQFRDARNPAKFIFDYVKKHNKVLEVSEDDYEAKQEAKYRAKFEAELKGKGVEGLPDLTNAAASESNTQDKEDDPGDRIDAYDDD